MIHILQIGMDKTYGGTEAFIMNYYKKIDKKQFSFDFIDRWNGIACTKEIQKLGGNIHSIGVFRSNPVLFIKNLIKVLTEYNYDIIHFHMSNAANIVPILVSYIICSKRIIVLHSHTTRFEDHGLKYILHFINTRILRKLPVNKWACSKAAGEWFWGKDFECNNIIPNAIDISNFYYNEIKRNEIRKVYHIQSHEKIIGFVGRFVPVKNVFFLLDILQELNRMEQNYKLMLVGGGDLENEFRVKAENLNLMSDIVFIGDCSNPAPFYSSMDVFVLPSLYEGLPVVGVEAQACGLSCFVSENITRELNITGSVQFLPIDKGAYVWAESIHNILSNNLSYRNSFPCEYDISHAIKYLEKKYVDLFKNAKAKNKGVPA